MTTNIRGEEDKLLREVSGFLSAVDDRLAQEVGGVGTAKDLAEVYKEICGLRESGNPKLVGMEAYLNVFRPLWLLHVPGEKATEGRFSGFALLHITPSITELSQILYEVAGSIFSPEEFKPSLLLSDDPRRGIPYTLSNFRLRTASANEENTLYQVALDLATEYAKVGSTGLVKYLTDTSDMLRVAYDQRPLLEVALPSRERDALEHIIHNLIRYNPHTPELRGRMLSDTSLYPIR